MNRKYLNLLLAAVSLGLVVAIYFSREKPKPPPIPITPLSQASLTHIVIHHDGFPDIVLDKQGGNWWLTKPVHTRADDIEINGVLELVTRSVGKNYPVAEANLAELGLDKPKWQVQFNNLSVQFGDLDPLEGQRYVRVGDRVDLVDDPPSAALDENYSDLVSKRLIPAGAKIEAIQFKDFAVLRNPLTGGWITDPKSADLGADAAQKLVNAWASAQSMWNARSDKLADAKGDVTVRTADGEFHFSIVDDKDQLVLGRADLGVTFTLPKTLAQTLFVLQIQNGQIQNGHPTSRPAIGSATSPDNDGKAKLPSVLPGFPATTPTIPQKPGK